MRTAGRGRQGTRRQKAGTEKAEHTYEKKEEQRVGEIRKRNYSKVRKGGSRRKGKREL